LHPAKQWYVSTVILAATRTIPEPMTLNERQFSDLDPKALLGPCFRIVLQFREQFLKVSTRMERVEALVHFHVAGILVAVVPGLLQGGQCAVRVGLGTYVTLGLGELGVDFR